jgi:hypothetical protein
MTFSLAPALEPRVRTRHIVIAAWLILVGAGVVIDHVSLSRLTRKTEGTAHSSEVDALQGRLAAVEEQLAGLEHQPAPVTQADFSAARQVADERLNKIEQVLKSSARANDLVPLQTRLEQVEARLEKARQMSLPTSVPGHRRAPEAAPSPVVAPPFAILGTELRGGEAFLSIAPAGTQSLTGLRVLHAGESQDGWRLEALDGKTATFRASGQVYQITVP